MQSPVLARNLLLLGERQSRFPDTATVDAQVALPDAGRTPFEEDTMNEAHSRPPSARSWNAELTPPPGETLLVDCRGLTDLRSLFNIARAMRSVPDDGYFDVVADDVAFAEKLRSWCSFAQGHVEDLESSDGGYRARVRPPQHIRKVH